MENQLIKSEVRRILPFDIKPLEYEDIELTDQQKVRAIREARAYKARKTSKSILDVKLTEAEVNEAFRLARAAEQGHRNEIAYAKRLQVPRTYPVYTAKEMALSIVDLANQQVTKLKGKPTEYRLDKFNRQIIWKLAQYFTNDPEFETAEFSLQKGIMLVGPVGCGKTMLMNLFRSNQKQSYKVIGCQQIGYEFAKNGFDVIQSYCREIAGTENRFGQKEYGVCFDDLGADEKRKFYGDRANALGEIIEGRYRMEKHYMTHITTNLDSKEIEEIYGLRVRSRMREMFNMLAFDHNSPDNRK